MCQLLVCQLLVCVPQLLGWATRGILQLGIGGGGPAVVDRAAAPAS